MILVVIVQAATVITGVTQTRPRPLRVISYLPLDSGDPQISIYGSVFWCGTWLEVNRTTTDELGLFLRMGGKMPEYFLPNNRKMFVDTLPISSSALLSIQDIDALTQSYSEKSKIVLLGFPLCFFVMSGNDGYSSMSPGITFWDLLISGEFTRVNFIFYRFFINVAVLFPVLFFPAWCILQSKIICRLLSRACPSCGYDRSGGQSPLCPECGCKFSS